MNGEIVNKREGELKRRITGFVKQFMLEGKSRMLKERIKNVPLKPGVYLYKDKAGEVIYVGKAKILRNRMRSYFQAEEHLHPKVRAMMNRVDDFDFIVTGSEVEALILENNLIKSYQPRYNIQLRDDKTYPYIKVTVAEKFPRVYITREEKDGVSRYFGPYTEAGSLRETLKVLTSIFPLRTCKSLKNKPRACLNYDIGRCLAPCISAVSEEEYHRVVADLLRFMEGDSEEIIRNMEARMREAAANLEFEKAARLRDQIANLNRINLRQKISFESEYNLDLLVMYAGKKENLILAFRIRQGRIIGKDTFWLERCLNEDRADEMQFFINQYYHKSQDIPAEILVNVMPSELGLIQEWFKENKGHKVVVRIPQRGDKKGLMDMAVENARLLWEEKKAQDVRNYEILLHLSEVLNLEVVPERIECYDISHLGGTETVASMVVFTQGVPDPKAYRRFKIKTEQNNDFASLTETLCRRFNAAHEGQAAFLPEPDLIIIDGGLGQVNAVNQVLKDLDIDLPLFSLAKKNEEIYRPGVSTPLVLARRDEALKLLQRLRDEAHRFAIEYNRQRRAKKVKISALDNITGIGAKRKKALLTHFGSVAKIKEASVEELMGVSGMNQVIAEKVYHYFRGIEG